MLGGRPRLVRLRAPGVEKAPTLVEGDTPFGSDTPRHPNRDPQGLYLIAIEPRALLLFPRQQQRQRGPAALVGRRLGDLDRARVFLRYSLLDRRESDAHKARALTAHRAEHRRESVAILGARRGDLAFDGQAQRIHGDLSFAPLDFLAGVEAARQ